MRHKKLTPEAKKKKLRMALGNFWVTLLKKFAMFETFYKDYNISKVIFN